MQTDLSAVGPDAVSCGWSHPFKRIGKYMENLWAQHIPKGEDVASILNLRDKPCRTHRNLPAGAWKISYWIEWHVLSKSLFWGKIGNKVATYFISTNATDYLSSNKVGVHSTNPASWIIPVRSNFSVYAKFEIILRSIGIISPSVLSFFLKVNVNDTFSNFQSFPHSKLLARKPIQTYFSITLNSNCWIAILTGWIKQMSDSFWSFPSIGITTWIAWTVWNEHCRLKALGNHFSNSIQLLVFQTISAVIYIQFISFLSI